MKVSPCVCVLSPGGNLVLDMSRASPIFHILTRSKKALNMLTVYYVESKPADRGGQRATCPVKNSPERSMSRMASNRGHRDTSPLRWDDIIAKTDRGNLGKRCHDHDGLGGQGAM